MSVKNKLLNTRMSDLGLGDKFNRYFAHNDPLLKDFITDNPLVRNEKNFITSATPSGTVIFNQYSVYWKLLRAFLIRKRFTYADWLMLLPRIPVTNGKGTRFNFELATKEQLLRLSIYSVQQFVRTSVPYQELRERVVPRDEVYKHNTKHDLKIPGKYHCDYLTIEKVLGVDKAVLPGVDTELFERMRPTLFLIKMRLKELGFTEADGPFMRLPLCKKPKEAYVDELVTVNAIPEEDALLAVHIGMEAKWIRTE